jgi:pyridoxamine 5'-phosphate oxidase
VPADPLELFVSWLHDAIDAGVSEPHAMTLSTVDDEGAPDARVLILKDLNTAICRQLKPGSQEMGAVN